MNSHFNPWQYNWWPETPFNKKKAVLTYSKQLTILIHIMASRETTFHHCFKTWSQSIWNISKTSNASWSAPSNKTMKPTLMATAPGKEDHEHRMGSLHSPDSDTANYQHLRLKLSSWASCCDETTTERDQRQKENCLGQESAWKSLAFVWWV